MKSPVWRGNRIQISEPISVVNKTKYISKIAERKLPIRHYRDENDYNDEKYGNFLGLYGIICIYIFLILAVVIGGGGIAVCVIYFNSEENTQQWKIGGIVLGVTTCITAIILMIVTIFKQTRNRPWRYKVQDVLLHPDNYFNDDINQLSSDNLDDEDENEDDDDDDDDESIDEYNNKTVDTTLSSVPNPSKSLLKTVHNDLVYCLGCNRLHSSEEGCKTPLSTADSLPPLKRTKSLNYPRNAFGMQIKEKPSKKSKANTVIDRSMKYSLSNEIQTDPKGKTNDTLVLKRTSMPASSVVGQHPSTKIMIVRVPKVAGSLVLQPKEH